MGCADFPSLPGLLPAPAGLWHSSCSSFCCCPGPGDIVPSCSTGHLLPLHPRCSLLPTKAPLPNPLPPIHTHGEKKSGINHRIPAFLGALQPQIPPLPAATEGRLNPPKPCAGFQPLCPQDVTLNFDKSTFTLKYLTSLPPPPPRVLSLTLQK